MTALAELKLGRDLIDYTQQYRSLPFEPVQIEYRRRLVLQQVAHIKPARLLEVGCGERPLFLDLPAVACTVVEPTPAFAQAASEQAVGRHGVRVAHNFVEDFDALGEQYDMIVASCVLHEVPDAQAFLTALRRLCCPETVVHVNVPNANSLHRLLAVAMGLIPDPKSPSQTQRTMQQRAGVYERESLATALAAAGLQASTGGTLFVKPFTHGQMQELIDQGFMTPAMLDGLAGLVNWLPDLGSELWVNAKLTPDWEKHHG